MKRKFPWYEHELGCVAVLAGLVACWTLIIAFVLWLIGR